MWLLFSVMKEASEKLFQKSLFREINFENFKYSCTLSFNMGARGSTRGRKLRGDDMDPTIPIPMRQKPRSMSGFWALAAVIVAASLVAGIFLS